MTPPLLVPRHRLQSQIFRTSRYSWSCFLLRFSARPKPNGHVRETASGFPNEAVDQDRPLRWGSRTRDLFPEICSFYRQSFYEFRIPKTMPRKTGPAKPTCPRPREDYSGRKLPPEQLCWRAFPIRITGPARSCTPELLIAKIKP